MTTSDGAMVVGGVDCHSQVHHAVALDETGRRLGDRGFPATSAGYADLLGWLRGFGFEDVDCYWKWREMALLGAVKPVESE